MTGPAAGRAVPASRRAARRLRASCRHRAPAVLKAVLITTVAAALVACAGGSARPVTVDTRNDACASCRMIVSDPRFAAQIAAPGEEPRFFDDIRCLRDYLASPRSLPRGAVTYVADHRTGGWVAAARAVYVHIPALDTPMGSHWVAYADAVSRDADPYARAGVPVAPGEIFQAAPPPDAGSGGRPGDGSAQGGG